MYVDPSVRGHISLASGLILVEYGHSTRYVAESLKHIQAFDGRDRLQKHHLGQNVDLLLRTWIIKRKIRWTLALDRILVAV